MKQQHIVESSARGLPSTPAVLIAAAINRKDWVNRKELAAHFGCSLQLIDSLIRRRVLPHIRVPGTRRILLSRTACETALRKFEIKSVTKE